MKTKKLIIFSLSCFLITNFMKAMEKSPENPAPELKQYIDWENLPDEIKVMILASIPQIGTYTNYAQLALTNSSINNLLMDKWVLPVFLKKFIHDNPQKAYSLFDQAIEAKNKEVVRSFLRADSRVTQWIQAAFLKAIKNEERLPVAEFLIEQGVDVNTQDTHGVSALQQAIRWSSVAAVNLLLQKGANTNAKDSSGTTPLHEATTIAGEAKIKLLLEHGAKINDQDTIGRTPLMNAVGYSLFPEPEIVKILLASGANPDIKDRFGNTAFSLARKLLTNEETEAKGQRILEMLTRAQEAKAH